MEVTDVADPLYVATDLATLTADRTPPADDTWQQIVGLSPSILVRGVGQVVEVELFIGSWGVISNTTPVYLALRVGGGAWVQMLKTVPAADMPPLCLFHEFAGLAPGTLYTVDVAVKENADWGGTICINGTVAPSRLRLRLRAK